MADHGRRQRLPVELVVAEYSGIVYAIVRRTERLWSDLTLDHDDLHQSGMVGLLEAAARFDPERGVPFLGFAWPRITGAVLDAVAQQTGVHRAQARSLRRGTREHGLAISTLRARPIDHRAELVVDDNDAIYPDRRFARREQQRLLALALGLLDDTERAVLAASYLDDTSLSALAREHGVSRSSMSRAHGRALNRLRAAIVDLVEASADQERPWHASLAALRRDAEAGTRRGDGGVNATRRPLEGSDAPPASAARHSVDCPLPSEILILAAKKKTPSVRQRRRPTDFHGEPAGYAALPAPCLSTTEVGHEHGAGRGCAVTNGSPGGSLCRTSGRSGEGIESAAGVARRRTRVRKPD